MKELLLECNKKLDILIKITAYKEFGEMKIAEAAPILSKMGLDSKEIASIINKPRDSVQVALSRAKKKEAR